MKKKDNITLLPAENGTPNDTVGKKKKKKEPKLFGEKEAKLQGDNSE